MDIEKIQEFRSFLESINKYNPDIINSIMEAVNASLGDSVNVELDSWNLQNNTLELSVKYSGHEDWTESIESQLPAGSKEIILEYLDKYAEYKDIMEVYITAKYFTGEEYYSKGSPEVTTLQGGTGLGPEEYDELDFQVYVSPEVELVVAENISGILTIPDDMKNQIDLYLNSPENAPAVKFKEQLHEKLLEDSRYP